MKVYVKNMLLAYRGTCDGLYGAEELPCGRLAIAAWTGFRGPDG